MMYVTYDVRDIQYEHTCNAAIIVKCIINSLVKTDLNQEEDSNRLVNYLSFNNSYSQTIMYSQKPELSFSMHTSLHFLPANVLLTPTGKPYKPIPPCTNTSFNYTC